MKSISCEPEEANDGWLVMMDDSLFRREFSFEETQSLDVDWL